MSDEIYIGVDLGGTRIRAAQCDEHLKILKRVETRTLAKDGLQPTLARIKDTIRQVLPDDLSSVEGIGISAPGPLNPETGVVVAPPNLPGWHNVPLGAIMHEAFDLPIFVGNDANVAVLAEAINGVARGYKNVIYITVSTGIGGGIISDGHMLSGDIGLGAEVGHMIMVVNDNVTTLERESAGPALARKARKRIENGEQSSIVELVNGDLDAIEGSTVGEAARAGDAIALDTVNEAARILGLGCVTLLHVFNPQMIVIGGGVANGLGDLLLNPMRETIHKHAIDRAYWENLEIAVPANPEDLSILGSAALVITDGGSNRVDEIAMRLKREQEN